jgi:hypothetical protein
MLSNAAQRWCKLASKCGRNHGIFIASGRGRHTRLLIAPYVNRSEVHVKVFIMGGAEVTIGYVDGMKESIEAWCLGNRPCSVETLA